MRTGTDGKVSLGQGRFGSVFPGKYKGRQVAVKRVALNQVGDTDNEEKALQRLCRLNSSEKIVDAIRLLMDHGIQSKGI